MCSNEPWEIFNAHPLSHGTLLLAHGPVISFFTSIPWVCANRPWEIFNVHPLSHGTLFLAHAPVFCWPISVPCVCSNRPWDTVGCPWSCTFLHHTCPMGHYALPTVLSVPPSYLSHGHVIMDHGTWQMFTHRPPCHDESARAYNARLAAEEVAKHGAELQAQYIGVPPGSEARAMSCPICMELLKTYGSVVLSFPALHVSHGDVPMNHGPFQMFSLCFMGHCCLLMVLSFPASHLSHGHVAMDHGTQQTFTLYPMGHCCFPMVLAFPTSHLSCGCVVTDHGT